MKIKAPRPIYLEGTHNEAVLLLHSFTGTIRDVKPLATALNQQGFTSYAPNYKGHGLLLSELTRYTIDDWWQDVVDGFKFLKEKGFEQINVAGVSLGGLFTLKLAETEKLNKIAVMSAPSKKEDAGVAWRMSQYGERLNQILKLSDAEAKKEFSTIDHYDSQLKHFTQFIDDLIQQLDKITVPARILYGEKDDASYQKSAPFIYQQINSKDKDLWNYSNAKHLMTHGEDSEAVIDDIVQFFKL